MKLSSLSEFTNDYNIEYIEEPVKCLGIYVGENKKELDYLNWNSKLDKIANILNLWKMRNLTYYGRVVIVKILAASQIVYTATAVRTPNYVIKRLNKLIYQYIWNSKKEKVKRNVCINSISDGGLGMIDLECKIQSLKLSWIYKFFNGTDAHWKSVFTYWASKIGSIHLCFKYNCCYRDMTTLCEKKRLPSFYSELFCTWCSLRHTNFHKVKDIANEVIWNNSHIKFQNEMLFYKK